MCGMALALVSLMHPVYGSLLLFIIAVAFLQRKCWHFVWQLNGWRGIMQQPILWLLLMFHLDPKSIMLSIQRFRNSFQFPLAIILFNRILLYVDDPVTMEGILTAPECINKTFMQNGFYANKGLLHAKDEKWKMRRKQLNPAFSHTTLVNLLDSFNRIGQELELKLATVIAQRKEKIDFVELEDLVSRAVLEVSCYTIMGATTNFTRSDEKGIALAYRYLMETTALRIMKPWYQIDFLFRLLNRRKYEKAKKSHELVEDFVAAIVQQKHMEWQKRLKQQMQHDRGVKVSTSAGAAAAATIETHQQQQQQYQKQQQQQQQQPSWCTGYGCNKNGSGYESNKVAPIADDAEQNYSVAEHRIFIDQIFYLVEMGKLTLQDVMNEAQSMMVVSFETVSTCVLNALLCLATNRDCQVKLRQEIKHQLSNQSVMTLKRSLDENGDGDGNGGGGGDGDGDGDGDFDGAGAGNDNGISNLTFSVAHVTEDNCSHCSENTNDDSGKNDDDDGDNDVDDISVDIVESVTISHLHCMPYLDMILNESLRLLSTVPINLRNASAEFQLNVMARDSNQTQVQQQSQRESTAVQGSRSSYNTKMADDSACNYSRTFTCQRRAVKVPKDTMVALDLFNMHRNEDYWGTNALTFYPQHFSKDHHQPTDALRVATRHSYAFIPFSKGLRTCIGHRYSIYLSKIILCKLITSFDFTTSIQLKDLQYCEGVSLKYRNSKDIQFTVRQVRDADEKVLAYN